MINLSKAVSNILIISLGLNLNCQVASAFPFDDSASLTLPSSGPPIHRNRIRSLSLSDGASKGVLAAGRFPKLRQIALESDVNNSDYIFDLVKNYPQIDSLAIIQRKTLRKESLLMIRQLNCLKVLNIDAPLEDFGTLCASLPTTTKLLLLSPRFNVTSVERPTVLHSLLKLKLIGLDLIPSFFSNLDAPNLNEIVLQNDFVDDKFVDQLRKYPRLKKINVYRTKISAEQLVSLNKLHIHVLGDPSLEPVGTAKL